MEKIYAGVGARTTPRSVQDVMKDIAYHLAWDNWILRSGGAKAADSAFEKGCDEANGKKEIYLPWKNFNGNNSNQYAPTAEAFRLALQHHPYPSVLESTPYVHKLMARNSQQIAGELAMGPYAEFVICWTPDGVTKKTTQKTGGTGQAIRMAVEFEIPVFNLADKASTDVFIEAYLKPIYDRMKEQEMIK